MFDDDTLMYFCEDKKNNFTVSTTAYVYKYISLTLLRQHLKKRENIEMTIFINQYI